MDIAKNINSGKEAKAVSYLFDTPEGAIQERASDNAKVHTVRYSLAVCRAFYHRGKFLLTTGQFTLREKIKMFPKFMGIPYE